MIRIGIQIESPEISSGPILQPADRERGAQGDAEQDHREGPDHVQRPRDHRVGPAAVVAGEQAEDVARIVVISAEARPMKSEVRPPYISRTISSRPRRPSAPRKNLPPAPNQTGPIGLPSRLTTSRFSPSTVDLLQRVGRVRARCRRRGWPTAAPPGRRRRSATKRPSEGQRHPVAPQPPVGQVPGAAPAGPIGVGARRPPSYSAAAWRPT